VTRFACAAVLLERRASAAAGQVSQLGDRFQHQYWSAWRMRRGGGETYQAGELRHG